MADCNALVSKAWPLATAPNSRTLNIPCGFSGLGAPAKAAGELTKAPPASQVPRKRRRLSLDFMKCSSLVGVPVSGVRNCGCEPARRVYIIPVQDAKLGGGARSYLARYQKPALSLGADHYPYLWLDTGGPKSEIPPSPLGRGWPAYGVFSSRRGSGEGLLPSSGKFMRVRAYCPRRKRRHYESFGCGD